MNIKTKALILFLFISSFTLLFGQEEIVIAGQVVDKADQQAIAFAKVSFQGSSISTTTNQDGFFLLRSNTQPRALVISVLGYKTKTKRLRKGQSVGLQVELEEKSAVLEEMVVYSGSNPAVNMMQYVRKNREKNNPSNRNGFSVYVDKYTQASISEISRNSLNNRLFRSMRKGMLFAQDSTMLLPILENKELFRLDSTQKYLLEAHRKDILPQQKQLVDALLSKLPEHINFYENYIPVFGKNFLSPIAQSSASLYKYHLKDSILLPSGKQYVILFRPSNNKDLAFEGEMHIDSATYALTWIDASMPIATNINFLKRLGFTQQFRHADACAWQFANLGTVIAFQLISSKDNRTKNSLFISQQNVYSDSVSGQYNEKPLEICALNFGSAIDTLGKSAAMRRAAWLADVMMNRYVHLGKFDFGPVTQLVSYNDVEGTKVTLGGRTGEKMWKNFTVGAYVAHAFGDESWKFGAEMQYRFKQQSYALLGVKIRDDVYQTDYDYHDEICNENSIGNGVAELLSAIAQSFPEKCSRRQLVDLFYDKEWQPGFNTHFSLQRTNYLPNVQVPFSSNTAIYADFQDYRLTLALRLSKKQRVLDEYFHRMFLSNKYPVLNLVLEGGVYALADTRDAYLKLHLLERQSLQLGNFGKFSYAIDAGYLFGTVPFSLLEIYSGVKNYGLDKFSLSLISLDQFAADAYLNLDTRIVTYGLLFNRIPLVKKLNLRELLSAKLAYGSLRNEHLNVMALPAYLKPMEAPYLVVGAGVANIFRIASVEYVMEMPKITNPKLYWGLRFKLYFDL